PPSRTRMRTGTWASSRTARATNAARFSRWAGSSIRSAVTCSSYQRRRDARRLIRECGSEIEQRTFPGDHEAPVRERLGILDIRLSPVPGNAAGDRLVDEHTGRAGLADSRGAAADVGQHHARLAGVRVGAAGRP